MQNICQTKRYSTVKQLATEYPAFSESAIRWLVFNSSTNGFNQCIRRIGRKVLIDLERFETWIDMQNN